MHHEKGTKVESPFVFVFLRQTVSGACYGTDVIIAIIIMMSSVAVFSQVPDCDRAFKQAMVLVLAFL